ncbi:MAG: zinc ribbon domain-containing protein [Acidobacteria bacterium]|nr:zinc ribbon domain-containing protein [Acidobacteriota bacterium]
MTTRKCSGCQAEMDADAIFCNECGLASPVPRGPSTAFSASEPATSPVFPYGKSASSDQTQRGSSNSASLACPRCGRQATSTSKYCSGCAFDFASLVPKYDPNESFDPDGEVNPPELVLAVQKRYREGYLYSRFLNGFGMAVVIIGIVIAIFVAMIAMMIGGGIESQSRKRVRGSEQGTGVAIGFVIFLIGAVFGGIFIVSGILTRAAAQHLMASFDSAVNSSRFLTNVQRAEMMSLPTQRYKKVKT